MKIKFIKKFIGTWNLKIGIYSFLIFASFILFTQFAFAPFIDNQVYADPGFVAVDIDYIVDPAGDYYSSGTVVSNNLLAGLTINSIDYFGYNCSIPANTSLQVMFSNDNVNWYSASHVADTYTDLSDGSHLTSGAGAIALSGFSPEYNFYYKVLLANTDTATTPTLIQSDIIYNTGSYATTTTQAASSVTGITATGNGNITNEGSSDVTKRGFQYGVSQTSGLLEVSETGSFSTGAYTLSLTNLYASTLYNIRSFVQNTEGRAYGSWETFTTNAYYPTSGTLQSVNLLAGQTVTVINSFYASATVPSGTSISAQFSQDNSTWYSADGTLDGSTTISNGTQTVSLSALSWSGANFYYKATLSANTSRDTSPTLLQIDVNYNIPVNSYWVGGTGNWSDAANHWACSSGGSASADCAPQSITNVYFDSSSGTGTVTIDSASVSVLDLNETSTNITIATSTNGITVTGDATVNGTISGATAVTLNTASKTLTAGSGATISSPVVLGATRTIAVASGVFIMEGIISDGGSAYGISKTGAGQLTFSGANTFTGGLTIKAGIIACYFSSSALGGSGTGVVTLGDSSGSADATLWASGGTWANPITVASGNNGTLTIKISSNPATYSGSITLNKDVTFLNGYGANNLSVTGGITGTGSIIINTTDTGTTDLTTTSINHTGTITNSGTGTGTTTISAVIGSNVTGVIQNSATSQLTLSGANTFTGGLTIKAGSVVGSTSSSALGGSGTGVVTLGDSSGSADATLHVNGIPFANPITVASGSSANTLSINTFGGQPALSGAITLNNDLTITSSNDYGPAITSSFSGTGNLILKANSTGNIGISTGTVNHTGTITNSGTGAGTTTISSVIGSNVTGVIQNSATSQLTLSGANTFTGGLTIKAGVVEGQTSGNAFGNVNSTITIGDGSVNANATLQGYLAGSFVANPITVASVSSGTLTIATRAGATVINTFPGAITLNHDLTLISAYYGTLAITSGISGNGNIIINAASTGGITLSDKSSIGTYTVNNAGTITNSGTGSGTTTISAVIGSNVTGVIQNSATSALTLSGNNSTVGDIDIQAGTLTLGNNTNLNVSDDWSNAGTFTAGTGSTVTFTSGNHTLTGANTFTNLTINANNTVTLPASTTQTIGGTMTCTGTAGNIITINSSSSPTQATFSKASGTVDCDYLSLTDNIATGGATFTATNSTGSNYDGWLGFDVTPPTTMATAGDYTFGQVSPTPVTVTLTCDDAGGSGCLSTVYCTDTANTCDPATPYTIPFEISAEGTTYVRFYSIDQESNTETPTNSETVIIESNRYWIGGTGNWNDTAHWSTSSGGSGGASVPDSSTNVYFDSSSGSGTVTINTGSVQVINLVESSTNITIATSTNGITVTGDATVNGTISGATAITLNTASKTLTAGSGATISSPVVLGATRTVAVATGTLTMSGIISDGGNAYGISKTGAGQLTLSGANTFTGGLTIKAGTVNSGYTPSANAFGTGTITIGDTSGSNDATLRASGWVTFANPITIASGSSGTLSIHGDLYGPSFSGAITLNNNIRLYNTTGNGALIFSGNISGTGNILFNSTGTAGITLSGASINPVGTITNSCAGTGTITISSAIGSNVTGVIQNSATSQLSLSGINAYLSGTTIKAGTLLGSGSNFVFGYSGGAYGPITLGDSSGTANATLNVGSSMTASNPVTVASGSSGILSIINTQATNPTLDGAITLNNNLTVTNSSTVAGGRLAFGGITGTGNIISNANNVNNISFGAINSIGTITNSGTGIGTTTISGVIGSNVTGVIQNSSTSALTLSGINTYTGPITNSAGTLNLTQDTTYSTMTLAGDTTTNFTNGKTFTISDLVSTATSGHLATIQTPSAGNYATLSDTAGTNSVSYVSIKDSHAQGGADWQAYTNNGNVNVSGNSGWAFNQAPFLYTASDTFTGIDDTALATHDSNWTDLGPSYTVAGLKLSSNQVINTGVWMGGGGRYVASTSDSSQIVRKGTALNGVNGNTYVAVRASASVSGYSFMFYTTTAGGFYKDGSYLASISFSEIDPLIDHTLKITASGTSTVTLTAYLDGVEVGTTTDSSSPYPSGNPGFFISDNGYQAYADDWTDGVWPSDGSSSTTTPTVSGNNVTFTATATDAQSNNYYFAVCKTNSITANNNSAPTCATDQTWCISGSTVSGSQASCNYLTSDPDIGSHDWYAFVCDHNAESICSAVSQGPSSDSGSPFVVVSANASPNAPTLVSPANASYTTDTTPTLSANYSDPDTGDVGTTNYRISSSSLADCTSNTNVVAWGTSDATPDNNENTTYTVTGGQALASDGTYYWCAQNDDSVLQSSWTQMGTFNLDTTAPVTTADAGSYTFNTWTNSNVVVTLICTDAGGVGCSATLYCLDTDNTCVPNLTYTTAVTISTQGTSYIRYASTDTVNNTETTKTQTIKIDKIDPVLAEVTSVTTPSTDTTPDYTFSTDKAGTITYGGSCSSATTTAVVGDNTITFNALSAGTYNNCTITVTDSLSNASLPLSVTAFTITVVSTPSVPSGGGGGGGINADIYSLPEGPFNILINDKASSTFTRDVVLSFKAGSNVSRMSVSNSPDFINASQEIYLPTKLWKLAEKQGQKTVYVKFFTKYGVSSNVFSANIDYNIKSTEPSGIVKQVEKITEQVIEIGKEISILFPGAKIAKIPTFPPIAISVPAEPQMVFRGGVLIPKTELEKIAILPLPEAIKDLALKFPKFGQTLEKVGVTKPGDLPKLQTAKLVFPGLSEASGTTPSLSINKFTKKEIEQVPTSFVFARVGKDNIDLNTKVAISNLGEPIKTINTIQNKPLYLVVKPDIPAKSVKGYVIFKSANSKSTFIDWTQKLSKVLSASLLDATNLPAGSEQADAEVVAKKDIVLQKFSYQDLDKDGIWTATIQTPVVDGKYEIRTEIDYFKVASEEESRETISMIMVVDPEGYIYKKIGKEEVRIADAEVSIYWQNPKTNQFELWLARDFQQENPQITDVTGKYSFLVPPGKYYLEVKSKDYLTYKGEIFEVAEGAGVHTNIELSIKNWFWKMFTIERIMLGIVIILLILIFTVIIFKKIKTKL